MQVSRAARTLTRRSLSTASAPRDSQTLTLPDGRTLGYAEYGPPLGRPLVFLHGFPTTRLEALGVEPQAISHGLRVISPDRPGFGLSSPQPGRRIVDFPADVSALLDHLGLDSAALLGGSGGGPYALACAAAIPDRLSRVGVLAGAPSWTLGTHDMPLVSRFSKALIMRAPGFSRGLTSATAAAGRWAIDGPGAARVEAWLAGQGQTDPQEARRKLSRVLFEAFEQGPQATVDEALLLSTDWGFRLEDVVYDPVKIWHGTTDARAPIRIIRDMAKRIPHAQLVEFEDGHFDIHKRLDDVLTELMR